jgi:hypothetical protein
MVGGIHTNNTYSVDFIAVKPRPPPNPLGVVALPPGHLEGPPQGAQGVVRPPLVMHGVAGQPMGLLASPVILFLFFIILFYYYFKNGGVFGNFCLTPLRIHTLLLN